MSLTTITNTTGNKTTVQLQNLIVSISTEVAGPTTLLEKVNETLVVFGEVSRKTVIQSPTNGINGKSAYQLALANGFVGTEVEWLASLSSSSTQGKNPVFIYTGDLLTRINYDDLSYKLFDYDVNFNLAQLDHFSNLGHKRKTFFYDINGNLDHIVEVFI